MIIDKEESRDDIGHGVGTVWEQTTDNPRAVTKQGLAPRALSRPQTFAILSRLSPKRHGRQLGGHGPIVGEQEVIT